MAQSEWLKRKLIFVLGKGGVGKSSLALATAQALAAEGKKTLLCRLLQVADEPQTLIQENENLWTIQLNATACFEEYIILKLKIKALYSLLLGSSITQYLEKAAPGVKEMVLLGKIWFERLNYDHVVVDMPSTGYALTMFNTPINFAGLFPGGPIHRDATEMTETFSNPKETAFATVTLPEEMPLQESIELAEALLKNFPKNKSWLLVNRLLKLEKKYLNLFEEKSGVLLKKEKDSGLWRTLEYLCLKHQNQQQNLKDNLPTAKKYFQDIFEISEVFSAKKESQLMGVFSKELS